MRSHQCPVVTRPRVAPEVPVDREGRADHAEVRVVRLVAPEGCQVGRDQESRPEVFD